MSATISFGRNGIVNHHNLAHLLQFHNCFLPLPLSSSHIVHIVVDHSFVLALPIQPIPSHSSLLSFFLSLSSFRCDESFSSSFDFSAESFFDGRRESTVTGHHRTTKLIKHHLTNNATLTRSERYSICRSTHTKLRTTQESITILAKSIRIARLYDTNDTDLRIFTRITAACISAIQCECVEAAATSTCAATTTKSSRSRWQCAASANTNEPDRAIADDDREHVIGRVECTVRSSNDASS